MEKQRSIKVLSVVALIVAVLGLTIAFAAASQALNITGTGTVSGNKTDESGKKTWDIHFEDVKIASTTGLAEATLPTETNSTVLVDYTVKLSGPGDSVTYTFDVVNNGKYDAKLTSLVKSEKLICTGSGNNAESDASTVCGNLTYTLTYADENNTPVASGDTLTVAEASKSMILTIAYVGDEIPSDDVTIDSDSLKIAMTYGQMISN